VAELLREYPDMRLTLTGRADDIGSDAMNEKLSTDRVNRLIDALAERGIAAERLQARAVGEEQPLRSGGSDMDRTDNRSVQFTLR
jgi:outer membrane protein OmpA-like peptidoglycan-associated protein